MAPRNNSNDHHEDLKTFTVFNDPRLDLLCLDHDNVS